jgi:hypothetical protein
MKPRMPEPEIDTKALLERSAEIDPQAWSPPLLGSHASRRLRSMQRAKEEFHAKLKSEKTK